MVSFSGSVWRLACLSLMMVALLLSSPAEAARKKKKRVKKGKIKPVAASVEPLDVVVLPFAILRGSEADTARSTLELDLELVDKVRVQDNAAIAADLDAAKDALDPAAIKAAMGRRSIEVLVTAPAGFERPHLVVFAADGKPRLVKELPRGAAADQVAATALAVLKPALPKWSAQKAVKLPARAKAGVDVSDVILGESDRKGTRRAPVGGDDDDAPTKTARRALDDNEQDSIDSGSSSARRSLTDIEDTAGDGQGPVKDFHLVAVSATFDGAGWSYGFAGNDDVQPAGVGAGFHPGGSIRADLWPLDFVGVDASASLSTVQFQINSSGALAITPNRFSAVHTNAGASVKGRYLLRLSDEGPLRLIGLGGRAGYRFWSASTETQRISSNNEILTVVPGFQLHAFTIGPEIYVPLFVLDRRFEIELKIDTMPITRYAEQPDNPGQNSLAFGYHAELLTRFDLFSGFFVEIAGKSTGAVINFEGEGDRVTIGGNDNDLIKLRGGRATNIAGGFSIGVGFMY